MHEYSYSEVNIHNKITNCWIIIHDRVYDITDYLEEHPGGQHILLTYAGKDATDAFDNIGHTSRAFHELNKYVIGRVKGTNVDLMQNVKKTRIFSNLFTHEDRIGIVPNVHKILGLYSLLHYLFRMGYCIIYQIRGDPKAFNAGFNSSYKSLISVLIHGLLSYSSLIFHISKIQRNKPMIWQEFRAHNIAFASRSILSFAINWLSARYPILRKYQMVVQSLVILGTFKSADIITLKLRQENTESTTRTLSYWDNCPYWVEKSFKYYYTLAQYQATLACFSHKESRFFFNPFIVMFPIQFASFLMTLVRKGIISSKAYHISYLSSLIIPFLIVFRNPWDPNISKNYIGIPIFAITNSLVALRIQGRLNKYAIWIPIAIMFNSKSYITDIKYRASLLIINMAAFSLVFKRSKARNNDFLHHKNQKRIVRLKSKKKLTHDTYELTFRFTEEKRLGLRIGEHVTVYSKNPNSNSEGQWNGAEDFERESIIKRKYTPIETSAGEFKLAIKEYKASERYPNGGKMSQVLANLSINDPLTISGPCGHNTYLGHGRFMVNNMMVEADHIFMFCAGTGLTPMYSILTTTLNSENDETTIEMLYVNKTKSDIMLGKEIMDLRNKYPDRYQVYNCLTQDPDSEADFHERPDKSILMKIMADQLKSDQCIFLLCGQKSFVNNMYSILISVDDISSKYIVVF